MTEETHGYTDLRSRARIATAALAVTAAASSIPALANLTGTSPLGGNEDVPFWIAYVVTVVVFLGWFYRAYDNIRALGVRRRRWRSKWAIIGWIIPFVGFWRPKQIMNDIWRASDPDMSAQVPGTWNDHDVPDWIAWWWFLFIVSDMLYRGTTNPDSTTFSIVQSSMTMLAAGLCIRAVLAITQRMNLRRERHFPDVVTAESSLRSLGVIVGQIVLVPVGIIWGLNGSTRYPYVWIGGLIALSAAALVLLFVAGRTRHSNGKRILAPLIVSIVVVVIVALCWFALLRAYGFDLVWASQELAMLD